MEFDNKGSKERADTILLFHLWKNCRKEDLEANLLHGMEPEVNPNNLVYYLHRILDQLEVASILLLR